MSATDSPVPGLPTEAFANDGLVTQPIIRAAALAHLRPTPGDLLWDLGVGAASVLIEWLRACPKTRAIGVERVASRLENARANVSRYDLAGRAELVSGDVNEVIDELETPQAIFIGGGLSSGVLEVCLDRLEGGGRLCSHAVTLEAEQFLAQAHENHGGSLTRISLESGDRIGRFRGWRPQRTVTEWTWTKGD